MKNIDNIIYNRLIKDSNKTFKLGQSILPLWWGKTNLQKSQKIEAITAISNSSFAKNFERDYMGIPVNLRSNYIKEFTIPLLEEDYNDVCSRVLGGESYFITDKRHIRLDYLFPNLLLDIEIDGSGCHDVLKDRIRDSYIYEKFGIRTIRLINYLYEGDIKWTKEVMKGAGKQPIPISFKDEIVQSYIDGLLYPKTYLLLDFLHKNVISKLLTLPNKNVKLKLKGISTTYIVDYNINGTFLNNVKSEFNYLYENMFHLDYTNDEIIIRKITV